ncbi:MAG: hypothetical protein MMC23_004301 [Stictis urceolatum]|nr:hypothetical protein [Stictis urceolata]
MLPATTLLALLPLALTAPTSHRRTVEPSRAFGLIASRSGTPIHLQPITASNSGLFIGLPTSAYCPSPPVPDCAGYSNDTLLICGSQTGSATGCSMDAAVPGGQQLYVDGTTGVLNYTEPHSGYIPPGAITSGFKYSPGNATGDGGQSLGSFGFCAEQAEGLYACPVEGVKGVWVVKAPVKGVEVALCLGMGVLTAGSNATAWEYT